MSTPQEPQQPPHGGADNPQHVYIQQSPKAKNGLGTTALVLGILAVLFAFIPIVGMFFAIPLGILALIFGGVGVFRAFRGKASNKGVAISGTTLAVVSFVVMGVMSAAVYNAANPNPPVAQSQQQSTGGGNGGGGQQQTAGIGDTVTSGDIAFTVHEVTESDSVGEGFMATDAKGLFKVVEVTMANNGNDAATMMSMSHYAYDSDGNEYQTSADAVMGDSPFLEQTNPGQSVEGSLYYDVPEGTELVKVEFTGGMLSDPVVVSLK